MQNFNSKLTINVATSHTLYLEMRNKTSFRIIFDLSESTSNLTGTALNRYMLQLFCLWNLHMNFIKLTYNWETAAAISVSAQVFFWHKRTNFDCT